MDYDLLRSDLKDAKNYGDRVNVNGDVFDCILPKDHKRFTPDVLDPRLRGRSDILNASLDIAVEELEPVVKYIDMIGSGNHEDAVAKYHGLDITQLLVHRLNKECGGNVKYGGKTGFISYSFRNRGKGSTNRVVIYYHHGAGGSAPVSRGLINFARTREFIDSDVIWHGHRHNRVVDATPLRMRCPVSGSGPLTTQQVCVQSGGYLITTSDQTPEEAMVHGRIRNYAEDKELPPQGRGGARLLVKFHRKGGIERIRAVL